MIETANQASIDALRAGDRDAFAQFVDETSTHVYRVAVKISGNEQDAEDVLQETYLKAFRSFVTKAEWLCGVIRKVLYMPRPGTEL